MNRIEKCEILKSKGYKYNPETGKILGVMGKEITNKHKDGYIMIGLTHQNNHYSLLGHHFGWYMIYNNVDFIELDHMNRIRTDNRICNLRISNRSQQNQNRNAKGYYWKKKNKKWCSQIKIDGKVIYLGLFNTEKEAKQIYLIAKEKYHII